MLNESKSLRNLTYDKIPSRQKKKVLLSGDEMIVRVSSNDGSDFYSYRNGGGKYKEIFFESLENPREFISVSLVDDGETDDYLLTRYSVYMTNGFFFKPPKRERFIQTDDISKAISVFNRIVNKVSNLIDLDDFDVSVDAIDASF